MPSSVYKKDNKASDGQVETYPKDRIVGPGIFGRGEKQVHLSMDMECPRGARRAMKKIQVGLVSFKDILFIQEGGAGLCFRSCVACFNLSSTVIHPYASLDKSVFKIIQALQEGNIIGCLYETVTLPVTIGLSFHF